MSRGGRLPLTPVSGNELVRRLTAALADEPRWIDVRGMLLSGRAEVTGGTDPATCGLDNQGFVVRLVHGAVSVVGVIGRPPCEALRAAISDVTDLTPVIVQTHQADWVRRCLETDDRAGAPAWRGERTIVHRLTPAPRPAATAADGHGGVRLVTASDPLGHLPAGLRHEITHARTFAPVAACFDAGTAVSFCYPVWRTETLWDVSIDTLEGPRGRSPS